jgi:hypothetical protein
MATGLLLSVLGGVFSLDSWRFEVLVVATLIAVGLGLVRPHRKLGIQRQVPRRWARTMEPWRRFALWGLMLGSGLATSIPYSAIIVLFAAQGTAPVAWAVVAGAAFGATREALTALPLVLRADLDQMMDSLVALRAKMQSVNVLVGFTGGLVLLIGLVI